MGNFKQGEAMLGVMNGVEECYRLINLKLHRQRVQTVPWREGRELTRKK